MPPEEYPLTTEDQDWLDMPSIGSEIIIDDYTSADLLLNIAKDPQRYSLSDDQINDLTTQIRLRNLTRKDQ